jgi:DNA-binding winged helix-turn-helix (wHTH) protein
MESTTSGRRVRFGQFEIDEKTRELRKDGTKIRLQEQPLQILQILLEHPGELVAREELRKRVWPTDTFVDFDHGINNAIKRLRESLGDTGETPRYIETLPCRGYRFLHALATTSPEVSIAVLYVPVDVDRSLATALETLQIEPNSYLGHWGQLTALNLQGRFTEAAEVGESVIKLLGRSAWMLASLARTYACLERRADSEALYMELRWRSKQEYVAPAVLAWAACAAGEQDEAIRCGQEAHAIGDPSLTAAKYWPDFAELRKDPRFGEILISRGWK